MMGTSKTLFTPNESLTASTAAWEIGIRWLCKTAFCTRGKKKQNKKNTKNRRKSLQEMWMVLPMIFYHEQNSVGGKAGVWCVCVCGGGRGSSKLGLITRRSIEMEEEGGRLEKDNYICVKNSVIQSFQCIKNVPLLKESKRANMYRIINMYP